MSCWFSRYANFAERSSLKLRFSFTRKTQKGRPLGQKFSRGTTKLNLRDKNNIVPSLGTPKFVCFLSKKRKKIEQQKKFAKKIGLGRKKSVKRWKRQWKSGFVVRKFYLGGHFLFHGHNFLLKNHYLTKLLQVAHGTFTGCSNILWLNTQQLSFLSYLILAEL